jgi:polygalacturonase
MCTIVLAACNISIAQPVPERYTTGLPFSMPEVTIPRFADRLVPISQFGAVADGQTSNTSAFRDAISACAKSGGGHVIVPAGMWLTGPIKLESNIDLHLEAGAVILFSKKLDDFPITRMPSRSNTFRCTPPISAYGLENVAITGDGVIDGSGEAWRYVKKDKLTAREWKELTSSGGVVNSDGTQWWPSKEAMNGEKYLAEIRKQKKDLTAEDFAGAREYLRPDMVEIVNCTNVLLDGPTFRNSPRFNIHPSECENLVIRNVTVRNAWNVQNGDGIDLSSCHNVVIYQTVVDVGDDGICLKPGSFSSRKNWKAACENIVISDCIVFRAHGGFVIGSETYGGTRNVMVRNCTFIDTDVGLRFKTARDRGGISEKVFINGITMKNIATDAILFDSFYDGAGPNESPSDRVYVGKPEPVTSRTPQFRDFTINNVVCVGARQAVNIDGLPESQVKNIAFSDVKITANKGVSVREAEGILFSRCSIQAAVGPMFTVTASTNISITNSAIPAGTDVFISVRDDKTNGIQVRGTDVSKARTPVEFKGKLREAVVDIR